LCDPGSIFEIVIHEVTLTTANAPGDGACPTPRRTPARRRCNTTPDAAREVTT
jgi:hypothetical protein